MMGMKARLFAPLPLVALEELVPPHHFYRHLEDACDLGFVRDLVRDADADIGRPFNDSVVFFTSQLIVCFEGAVPNDNSCRSSPALRPWRRITFSSRWRTRRPQGSSPDRA